MFITTSCNQLQMKTMDKPIQVEIVQLNKYEDAISFNLKKSNDSLVFAVLFKDQITNFKELKNELVVKDILEINGTINFYNTKENTNKFFDINSTQEKIQMITISDIRILQ
jgi:hypothetical protein